MGIDFYYMAGAAPSRAVLMTAKAVGVHLNLIPTSVFAGEQLKPEYIKLNPTHTVPTLVDDGFVLWESRVICIYLISKYGKDRSLYPEEVQLRALIDQYLYFDCSTLYARFGEYWYSHLFNNKEPLDPAKLRRLEEAVGFLETFLKGKEWLAGERLTVADISVAASVSTFEVQNFDFGPYPNVRRWLAKAKVSIPGYELNEAGLKKFREYFYDKRDEYIKN